MKYNRTWIFSFCVLSILLFEPQIGLVAIVLILFMLAQYCLLNSTDALEAFAANKPLILLGTLSVFSAAWSRYPSLTFYYGIQFLITILVAIAVSNSERMQAIYGSAIAFGVYIVVSLLLGKSVAWGNAGGQAFAGLNGGKSALGGAASVAVLLNLGATISAFRRGNLILAALTAALVVPCFLTMILSRTTGSIVGLAAAVSSVCITVLYRKAPTEIRALLIFAVVVAIGVVTIFGSELAEASLTFFGKGADLTGRSYLWLFADRLIEESPWLGSGYNGFWVQGNQSAEHLWLFGGIQSRSGFNFHNSIREILVSLGAVGLFAFGFVYVKQSTKLAKLAVRAPSAENLTWLALLMFGLSGLPVESVVANPFNYSSIVLYACLSYPALRTARKGGAMIRATQRISHSLG